MLGVAMGGSKRRASLEQESAEKGLNLPKASLVRLVSVGYERLASDYYWLLAIQYYGADGNRRDGCPDLHRILELTTDLDPLFLSAYRFGAVAIPVRLPEKGWWNAEAAIRLLEKGVKEIPDSWLLAFLLSYGRLEYLNDVAGAAEALERASKAEGRPAYLPLLATRLRSHAGAPESALSFARALLQSTQEPQLREELQSRVRELEVEIALRKVESAVVAYRGLHGALPRDLSSLLNEGMLSSSPPADMEIEYDSPSGAVTSRHLSRRLTLRRESVEEMERERAEKGSAR